MSNLKDPENYVKLNARICQTIDVPVVCPQSKEEFALVYRVESRHEFDNCLIDAEKLADNIVGLIECEGSKLLQTAKFDINVLNNSPIPNYNFEFEEGKEYYYISTSHGPGDRFDRPCDGFFVRFSIKVEKKN